MKTNCKNCRYNSRPTTPGVIGCAVNPLYWTSPKGTCTDFAPLSRQELQTIRQQAFAEARHDWGIACVELVVELLDKFDTLLGRLSPSGILILFLILVRILVTDNPLPWLWWLLGLVALFIFSILAEYCRQQLVRWLCHQSSQQQPEIPISQKAAAYAELIEAGIPHLLKRLDEVVYLSPRLIARIEALPHYQFQALCWDIDRIHSGEALEHWLMLSFREHFLRDFQKKPI